MAGPAGMLPVPLLIIHDICFNVDTRLYKGYCSNDHRLLLQEQSTSKEERVKIRVQQVSLHSED